MQGDVPVIVRAFHLGFVKIDYRNPVPSLDPFRPEL